MIEFLKTIGIATIPATITSVISYLIARYNANTQIKSINEQNKADIEKLVEQHNVDIDALKEKHKLDLEIKDKDHTHEVELITLQHNNDLNKSEENMKNQLTMNALSSLLGGVFNGETTASKQMNDYLQKSLIEEMSKGK